MVAFSGEGDPLLEWHSSLSDDLRLLAELSPFCEFGDCCSSLIVLIDSETKTINLLIEKTSEKSNLQSNFSEYKPKLGKLMSAFFSILFVQVKTKFKIHKNSLRKFFEDSKFAKIDSSENYSLR